MHLYSLVVFVFLLVCVCVCVYMCVCICVRIAHTNDRCLKVMHLSYCQFMSFLHRRKHRKHLCENFLFSSRFVHVSRCIQNDNVSRGLSEEAISC